MPCQLAEDKACTHGLVHIKTGHENDGKAYRIGSLLKRKIFSFVVVKAKAKEAQRRCKVQATVAMVVVLYLQ